MATHGAKDQINCPKNRKPLPLKSLVPDIFLNDLQVFVNLDFAERDTRVNHQLVERFRCSFYIRITSPQNREMCIVRVFQSN